MKRLCVVFGVSVLLLSACGDGEDWRDKNKPATFFHECTDESDCAASFQCLTHPALARDLCTAECDTDADCPRWRATGQCAGNYQSPCRAGICDYQCE